ncbi:polysaccharide lyase family protein [Lactiplantibacillus modestisalitolerans]|uniref:rhamnogalacturonan endolyase n=1 Tax=Lactiplantibacillus modestisalitolerans TaxID=1457219 RepID=A0ABV5WSX8_9LACO|nr:polysaccharide lyase family protein [Lactiplantibacillus modestisalitolerans]
MTTNKMTAKITNAHLEVELTAKAMVGSLKLDGQELLNNLTGEPRDPDKDHSFYLDYHMNSKTVNMRPTKMEVIANTPEIAHVAYTDDQSDLGLRYHLIVRGDDKAIYGYVEAWNNSDQTLKIQELRTVYRLDHDLFNIGYNSERIGHQPSSAHMMTGEKLQDETYRMTDGSFYSNSAIYSKYDYAGYLSENPFWGQYGSKYGLWFIPTDRSYFPSGPLNQDLLLHYDGLILNYLTASHFGTGDTLVDPDWHKFYGPWCVLVTDQPHPLAAVKQRVKQEQAAWPYQWVQDDNYPLALGTASGQVTVDGQTPQDHYEVVLAQPSQNGETFMRQRTGYIYYAETDDQGHFEINNVRPDNYTAYAYAKGGRLVGTYHWDDQSVAAGTNDLGALDIATDHAKLIWQIGTSTHTADGFKFSDQLRNHIWKDLVPNNLTYHVGEPSDDWYYLQNDGGVWRIIFNGRQLDPDKPAKLTIAFAAVTKKIMTEPMGTRVEVDLNNQTAATHYYEINDSAGYRSAVRGGNYNLLTIELAANQIHSGKNILAIKTDGYLMYDTIKLEQAGD